jgi:hypothetical protein
MKIKIRSPSFCKDTLAGAGDVAEKHRESMSPVLFLTFFLS